ncbi:hypothetical protein SD71_00575 [Cohnella kolymensis]|uniref:DUF1450 domain-containing protein n=1 Tax=Cohnella kolymensis TaxID=1590652 RepID=A0ABR5A988_9BACL|nr:DUF1450 domain-containing protein [Cohnella kolymensis]KIL37248.1 hypothetical protein SD71_00575 [Cohnella kolymensis]
MESIESTSAALNDIRICDKCKHMRVKSMLSKLDKMSPGTEVKVGCKSYCGPCSRYAFVFVNGRYVTAPTEDEAIEKARKYLKI